MPSSAVAHPEASVWVVVLLALLLGLQPVTTDLYLPALPMLTRELGAAMPAAQLTLSALLLAFGASQLVWGPLSDRFGRRPVLLAGLGLYVAASLGSAWAPSIQALIVWRTLQGAAMGAAVMGARAIVRDLFVPSQGVRVMSQALSGLGVIACLSAPTGGWLTQVSGWRTALLALGVFAAISLGLVLWRFEESLAQRNPHALALGTLRRTWAHILRHPTFWAYGVLSAASYGGLFTFLAASSFVFTGVLGLSKAAYGTVMAVNSVAYLGGTFVCRRWLGRYGVRATVRRAGWLSLAGGLGQLAVALSGMVSVWTLMAPQLLYMVGHGIHQPCGTSGSVGPFPKAAGAASALNGFGMMLCAFATGAWLGHAMNGTALPMAAGVAAWSVVLAGAAWTLVQRHGEPPKT
jgi:DHA1 family bicyclomycin/chloramphenicol resistance-like MFS transporter